MVIGLSGKMGSGKDAVAALLTMRGYERFAFADALRREVEEAIIGGHFDEMLDGRRLLEERRKLISEVWSKPTTDRMRGILQQFGMLRREQVPGYWIKTVKRAAERVDLAVISDVRFKDEAEMVWSMGGEVWRIERPGLAEGEGSKHISELILFDCDRVILNDGSMETLALRVREALEYMEVAA